jgi:D-amino-acid dehydrogenase
METTDILVIGGGIVGAAIADAVSRDGSDVLLVERGTPGHGCSYGNAGWVTPCFATPLPRPGLLWKSLRWMADPESPLYIAPRPDPSLIRWLARFAGAMRTRPFQEGTSALVELSRFSLEHYASLSRTHAGGMDMIHKGLLLLGLTARGFAGTLQELEMMEGLGVQGKALNPHEIRTMEPAIKGPVAGGVHYPNEAHLEPLEAVRALLARAEAAGSRLMQDTEVIRLTTSGGRIDAVQTTRGWIKPREVILALGIWTREIAARISLRVPLLGGKGYSMTLDHPDTPLRTPVMVVEKKVAITPHGSRLRLAGTLELVKDDFSVSTRRVETIYRTGGMLLGLPDPPRPKEIWRGLRPCTPDGMPIIGRPEGFQNLVLATGHQMLGMQTAPATGRLVSDLVHGLTPTFDPAPFKPSRFR